MSYRSESRGDLVEVVHRPVGSRIVGRRRPFELRHVDRSRDDPPCRVMAVGEAGRADTVARREAVGDPSQIPVGFEAPRRPRSVRPRQTRALAKAVVRITHLN